MNRLHQSKLQLLQDENQFHQLRLYFIGIGGIGMSALARYFNTYGAQIFGYDKMTSLLTQNLIDEGITINFDDDINNIPENIDVVIYTPAIPPHHKQYNYLVENGFAVLKRADVLQIITAHSFTIAIAGSHGKTTVTTLIAHIFLHARVSCRAFLGGLSVNYNSNFLQCNVQNYTASPVIIVEADEFDRSFLKLKPNIAIITAIDTDHLDIYGSKENIESAFNQFADLLHPSQGKLIFHQAIDCIRHTNGLCYGLKIEADYYADKISFNSQGSLFSVFKRNNIHTELLAEKVKLNMGGKHNIENTLAAFATAHQFGLDKFTIVQAIQTFKGIKRRFEIVFQTDKHTLIDDYAHHPEEILRCIEGIQLQFPGKKLMVIFQPHLYSRTLDLYLQFAQALKTADKIILLDIYPARENPIEGVSSHLIFDALPHNDKICITKDRLLQELKNTHLPEIICTMGAGDIDTLIQPIQQLLA